MNIELNEPVRIQQVEYTQARVLSFVVTCQEDPQVELVKVLFGPHIVRNRTVIPVGPQDSIKEMAQKIVRAVALDFRLESSVPAFTG